MFLCQDVTTAESATATLARDLDDWGRDGVRDARGGRPRSFSRLACTHYFLRSAPTATTTTRRRRRRADDDDRDGALKTMIFLRTLTALSSTRTVDDSASIRLPLQIHLLDFVRVDKKVTVPWWKDANAKDDGDKDRRRRQRRRRPSDAVPAPWDYGAKARH